MKAKRRTVNYRYLLFVLSLALLVFGAGKYNNYFVDWLFKLVFPFGAAVFVCYVITKADDLYEPEHDFGPVLYWLFVSFVGIPLVVLWRIVGQIQNPSYTFVYAFVYVGSVAFMKYRNMFRTKHQLSGMFGEVRNEK